MRLGSFHNPEVCVILSGSSLLMKVQYLRPLSRAYMHGDTNRLWLSHCWPSRYALLRLIEQVALMRPARHPSYYRQCRLR